jgi:ubiquinone/menaquinone biosynthesis C-methylase UbiE
MTQELKNIDFWERLIQNMPDSYRKWFEMEREYLRGIINKDANVLDIACGDGRSFKDIIDITKNLTGVDHEKKAIDDAKVNFKDHPEVKFVLADARKLPFEDNSFDFVICMGSFANFEDYKIQALREMRRVAIDDGFVILSVYSEDAFEERMKLYKREDVNIKEIQGTTVIFDEISDNISEQFSREKLEELFKEAGLEVVEIKKLSISYVCKLREKLK